ncbi:hypothetical protein CI088_10065 [Enterococcus plantarum]|uniref:HTH-type transcriptional regulator Rgg C-terminal domain-containing protein n=1 Tax=Enterococcus plantarum TaxID=1077675 RepID=A0A2W3Z5R2_9ENTE|nr:hypothetical protein [Enterococcus plantarum]PZL72640.1 hypothetical protein CI088_10065 [Enterococcus plantarum]
MNIGETLYYFRKNRNMKQREILDYSSSSIYSKIESNRQEIRLSELIYFLKKTEITEEEFFEYIDLDEEQKKFRKLFKKCSQNPKDQILKKKLCSYDFDWQNVSEKKLQELSNYVVMHLYFSKYWYNISPLTQEQIRYIYELLNSKSVYFQYDYILLANTIFLFTTDQSKNLFMKVFPLKKEQILSNTTKSFISSIMNNMITKSLRNKDYNNAKFYVSIAKEQEDKVNDIAYKIIINYLENLTKHMITGKYAYLEKVYDCIKILKDIREFELANSIELEVESLTVKEGYFPETATTTMYININ